MPVAFDGTRVPARLETLPCGGTPWWDWQSECGYRCDSCNAVIGSIGMPERCREMMEAGGGDDNP